MRRSTTTASSCRSPRPSQARPALELLLPLTLKWAHEAKIPLAAALARITAEPARVLGVDAGHLAPGAAADVCIVAIDERWTVTRDALKSQGKNTPFLGLELAGRVRYTLVDGQIVYESDAAPGSVTVTAGWYHCARRPSPA